jgi:hypothetical protein
MEGERLFGGVNRNGFYRRNAEGAEKGARDSRPWLRSEDVAKLASGDFFVSKLIVFSTAFCAKKEKIHSPLRMTAREPGAMQPIVRACNPLRQDCLCHETEYAEKAWGTAACGCAQRIYFAVLARRGC